MHPAYNRSGPVGRNTYTGSTMRKLIAALSLVALAACGDMLSDPLSSNISGRFDLRTVDGQLLPYTIRLSGGGSASLTSDVLTVGENGTWSEVYSYVETVNGRSSTGTGNDGGTWSRSSSTVNFRSNQSQSDGYSGTYSGGRYTLSDGYSTYVFEK